MPRLSAVQQFLDRLSPDQRSEAIRLVRTAPTSKQAYKELKQLGYKASYDAVINWRGFNPGSRTQSTEAKSGTADSTSSSLEVDPIKRVMHLSEKLNALCESLTGLLERHQWIELGETRLANREALKILSALPALSRAAAGSVVELTQIKGKVDERVFALAIVEELRQDWQRVLQHDNPELIPLFTKIADVTMTRLEIDRGSLLEDYLNERQEAVALEDATQS